MAHVGLSARQSQIADAAVAVIARGGARALTHRAVDHHAGLPIGSTSFSARTRQDLLELAVRRISEITGRSLDDVRIPSRLTVDAATDVAVSVLRGLAQQVATHRARVALLLELGDDSSRRELTADAPVRAVLLDAAERLLTALGIADAHEQRIDLVGLIDALLLYSALDIAPLDVRRVLRAHLAGLPPASTGDSADAGREARPG